jgi:hypothetical protein
MSVALEPVLDRESLRVLRAIPECGENQFRSRTIFEAVTLWQVAETIDSTDLRDVQLTLNGLVHLGYTDHTVSKIRKRQVYWRTRKGDDAVANGRAT